MNPENILVNCVKNESGFWQQSQYVSPIENWNTLANSNPIQAAIAVSNEKREYEKGKETIEMLAREMRDGVVLDIGCGYGRILKYLSAKRTFSGYIGADSSKNLLTIFSDRYKANPVEQKTPLLLVHTNIDALPIKDKSVDNVIVSAVFLHNPKDVVMRSMQEIERVLKPGGKLFVLASFPNKMSLTGLQGVVYLFALKLVGKGQKNGPVRYFSHGEISAMLQNFSSTKIIPTGFSVLPKTILILPKFLKSPYKQVVKTTNSLLSSFLPKKMFSTNFDVIAEK